MELDLVSLETGTTLLTPDTVAMYRMAAKIADSVVASVAALCQPGARIAQLCEFGDITMAEQVGPLFLLML